MMNNIPRQKLREIILQYGRSLCDDPKRCEALLQDFCGQYRKEISVLIIALKERVPADLLASPHSIPPVVLLARLTKRLQESVSLTEDAARWAVESWGLALGVISEADIDSIPSSSSPPQVPPQYRQDNNYQTRTQSESWYSEPPPVSSSYRQQNIFQQQSSPSSPVTSQTPLNIPITSKRVIYHAGFWRRFAAYFLDIIVVALLGGIVVFVGIFYAIFAILTGSDEEIEKMQPLFNLLGIIINWLYFTLMESSSKQATLGKMALGIYVTDLNGKRISFGRANGRYFGKILSGLILGIGFLMIAFTEKKQGLHDMMAGCLVIKKQSIN